VALTLSNGFVSLSLTNLIYESVDVRSDDPKVVIERVAAALRGVMRGLHGWTTRAIPGWSMDSQGWCV
jgi:hypothetical protein